MNSPFNERSFFAPRWFLAATLVLLFGLGLAIRLYDLTDLPLDFQPTRQLLGALKTRGIFYQTAPGIPDWQRQMALQQWRTRAEVEPEIVEHLVAFTYQFTGEQLWVGRVYSSLFWMIGGIFLYLLIRDLVSTDGAVIATAYYLFLPFAVIASRSLQPDPFMVMVILSFWWAIHRWAKGPSWPFAILAGLLGGFAIFIKLTAAFFVIGAALGEVLGRFNLRNLLRNSQIWLIALLGVLPGATYLFYGIVLNGFLGRQFSGRFIPSLLLSPINYIEWAAKANTAAGGVTIVLGLLAFFIARDRSMRIYLFSLWGAYILYGLYFDYHIATHDYYQLPFIPLVAVSLAPAADWVMGRLAEASTRQWTRVAAAGVLLYGVLATVWEVRAQLKSVDYRPEATRWVQIGDLLGHSSNVVALTQDYGERLNYWGWQNAIIWPNSNDIDYHELRGPSINSRIVFANMTKGKTYFLVTDFVELNRQVALKQDLSGLPVYAQGDGYIIYDLRKP
jgi:4-amino-4-deoxy-L-arabinose transferase-like glycosyltransferase